MVELDSLENCCGASHRGFESHSLRFFFNGKSKIGLAKLLFFTCGAVAQLGECIPRTDEVTGSNPVCSIPNGGQLSVISSRLKTEFVELNSLLTDN